jgi:hypothetical protein
LLSGDQQELEASLESSAVVFHQASVSASNEADSVAFLQPVNMKERITSVKRELRMVLNCVKGN